MTATNDNRKRTREDDGSDSSSMPLSKRINNLNINNSATAVADLLPPPSHTINPAALFDEDTTMGPPGDPWSAAQQQQQQQQQLQFQQQSSTSSSSSSSSASASASSSSSAAHQHYGYAPAGVQPAHQQHCSDSNHSDGHPQHHHASSYEPELSNDENPFYYNKNKLLFGLHAERMRRQQ